MCSIETKVTETFANESRSGSGPIMNLYPEILTQVFQYLEIRDRGRVTQTCRYFRDIAYDNKRIWRGIEAKLHLRKNGNHVVYQSLSKRGIHKVQVLSLKRSLRELVTNLPSVTSLRLSGCYNVTDWTLSSAFSPSVMLTWLTTLDLSLCKQVSDVSLARIASKAPNLQRLELGGCTQISDRGLLLISWGLRKLTQLNFRSCSLITDEGIGFLAGVVSSSHLQEPRIHEFLRKLGIIDEDVLSNNLQLKPSYLPIPPPSLQINKRHRADENQCAICKSNQQFIPAAASSASQSNQIGSSTSSIMKRKIARQQKPISIDDNLPKIRPGETEFGTKLLQHLILQDCQKLTDEALGFIANFQQLEFLNLSFCVHITDTGLRSISRVMSLKELNLRSVDNLTDRGLANLSECGRRLRALDISFCDKIGDSGLFSIAQFMPNLQALSLSACDIGDDGLRKIGVNLKLLRTLNLGQCSKITDSSLTTIAEKCRDLQYIDLYGCTGITPSLLQILMTNPKIRTINLGLWQIR